MNARFTEAVARAINDLAHYSPVTYAPGGIHHSTSYYASYLAGSNPDGVNYNTILPLAVEWLYDHASTDSQLLYTGLKSFGLAATMAEAFQALGNTSPSGYDFSMKANYYLLNAQMLQWSNGMNPTGTSTATETEDTVSNQADGLVYAERYYTIVSSPSLLTSIYNSLLWESQRVDIHGEVAGMPSSRVAKPFDWYRDMINTTDFATVTARLDNPDKS